MGNLDNVLWSFAGSIYLCFTGLGVMWFSADLVKKMIVFSRLPGLVQVDGRYDPKEVQKLAVEVVLMVFSKYDLRSIYLL